MDTLRGSRSEKIEKYRMNQNSYYAAMRDVSLERLRQIMKHLLAQGYLTQTDDRYAVLKLTENSYEISVKGEQVMMKLPKEKVQTKSETRVLLKKDSAYSKKRIASDNPKLYEALRELRNQTAKELSVPAYVVFTDKTLHEMSAYLPTTREEMLQISGVAQAKYEKFGRQFGEVIKSYKEENVQTPVKTAVKAKIKF